MWDFITKLSVVNLRNRSTDNQIIVNEIYLDPPGPVESIFDFHSDVPGSIPDVYLQVPSCKTQRSISSGFANTDAKFFKIFLNFNFPIYIVL